MNDKFEKFERVMVEKKIYNPGLWDIYETNFQIDYVKDQLIITIDLIKVLWMIDQYKRDYITLVEFISSTIKTISLMLLI